MASPRPTRFAAETGAPRSVPSPEPMAGPVTIGGVRGWYSPGTRRRGVVLCGTFGFEQMCAYRAWRELAQLIAEAGCPTLRIDYPGQGDSSDAGAEDADAWIGAIRGGIEILRGAGAEEIVLVGLRLGGTLAALAAQAGGVDRLVLLAPFATGKAYLREMALQSRMIDILPDRTPLAQRPGSLMVGSFHLGPDALAALGRIDLLAQAREPVPDVLLLGAAGDRLAAHFRSLGSRVETGPFAELTQLVADPLFAATPHAVFAAIRDFTVRDAPAGAAPLPLALRADAPAPIRGPGWEETISRFGAGLFGVLCRPQAGRADGPTVLLIGSGRNMRAGQGRQGARLARRLAAAGIASFRFDPLGIGDSADRPDGSLPVYAADAVAEVRAALDHLDPAGAGTFVILGSCSGSYLGYQAICRDTRVAAAVLINLYCFNLKRGLDIEAMIRDSFRNGLSYTARARQGRFWRRILRGEIRPGAVARAVWRDGLERLRRLTVRIPWLAPGGETVARQVARLRRRGARIRLIYSAGDQGIPVLGAHLGHGRARLAQRLGYPVTVLEGVDHNLSMPEDQERLFAILTEVVRDVGAQAAGSAAETTSRRAAGRGGLGRAATA